MNHEAKKTIIQWMFESVDILSIVQDDPEFERMYWDEELTVKDVNEFAAEMKQHMLIRILQ